MKLTTHGLPTYKELIRQNGQLTQELRTAQAELATLKEGYANLYASMAAAQRRLEGSAK